MPGNRCLRDPVHGSIELSAEERRLLDHPWLQRLRHVSQLGFVSLAFPGAVHDRFQHSLGVMHLAGYFFDRLIAQTPGLAAAFDTADLARARRVLRVAALLHDVGHPPFSHSLEAALPPVESVRMPDAWFGGEPPRHRRLTHEDLTLAVLARLGADGTLDTADAADAAALLHPAIRPGPWLAGLGQMRRLLAAVISSELDADRCDYLLRDSHYAGVPYGRFDLQRLLECLRVLEAPAGPEIGLRAAGVPALEGLFVARHHMFVQVYLHKTPQAFEHYLERAAAELEIDVEIGDGVEGLLELRDDTLKTRLLAAARRGAPWSRRIVEREPAVLMLRQWSRDEADERRVEDLAGSLRERGCTVFVRRGRRTFAPADGQGPLCLVTLPGRSRVESMHRHSPLLDALRRPSELVLLYVLRRDRERAEAVARELETKAPAAPAEPMATRW